MSDKPQPQKPAPAPAPTPPATTATRKPGTFRIHLLVKDGSGIIRSEAGVMIGLPSGPLQIGTTSRWRAACDPSVEMGKLDRGTVLPWGVRCQACRQTQAFKDAGGLLPKPGSAETLDLVSEP